MAWTDFLGGALSVAPQLLERRRQFDADQEARKQQQQFQQIQLALQARDQELQEETNRRDILKEAIASAGPGGVMSNLSPELAADAERFLPGRLQKQEPTLSSTQFGPAAENFITPDSVGPIGDFAATPSPGQAGGHRVVPTVMEQEQLNQTADAGKLRKIRDAVIAELESGRAFSQPPQKLEQLRGLGAAVGIQVPATHQEWKDKQDYEQKQRLEVVNTQGANTIAAANVRQSGRGQLTPSQELNQVQRLRNSYIKETSTAREINRQYGLMREGLDAAKQGMMNPGSQSVLVTFQKILDPDSVVRESEYARSPQGLGLYERARGMAIKIQKGGAGVPPEQLQEFAVLAESFLNNALQSAEASRAQIDAIADAYDLDKNLITSDIGPAMAPAPAPGGAPVVGTPGSRFGNVRQVGQ